VAFAEELEPAKAGARRAALRARLNHLIDRRIRLRLVSEDTAGPTLPRGRRLRQARPAAAAQLASLVNWHDLSKALPRLGNLPVAGASHSLEELRAKAANSRL
jgi:hypothetical protein